MYLRVARPLDLPTIGEIQAVCNTRDTIARYSIKDMEKYSTTYRRGSIRFCKRRSAAPGTVTLVVETEPSDYTSTHPYRSPEVIGFVIYDRIGTSAKAREWQRRNQGWFQSLNRTLDEVEDQYLRVFTNVECTFKQHLYKNIIPLLRIPFDPEVFAEAWEVDLLFVRPDWQRRGVGRKLLQWGFERATEEQVPVIVKSSALGAAAYRATGFRSMGEIGLREALDTLEFGGEEPQMWCWEPKGSEGKWFKSGKEALEKFLREREEAKKKETGSTSGLDIDIHVDVDAKDQ